MLFLLQAEITRWGPPARHTFGGRPKRGVPGGGETGRRLPYWQTFSVVLGPVEIPLPVLKFLDSVEVFGLF